MVAQTESGLSKLGALYAFLGYNTAITLQALLANEKNNLTYAGE